MEPEAPSAPEAAADPAAPQAPAGAGVRQRQSQLQASGHQPLPAQAAADPEAPQAAETGPAAPRKKIETRTGPTGVVLNLHDKQEITMVGPWGEVGYGNVPWRDGGGNSFFGKNVYGTMLGLNPDNQIIPWIATSLGVQRRLYRVDLQAARGRGVPGRDAAHGGRLQGLLGARRQAGEHRRVGRRIPVHQARSWDGTS